MGSLILCGGRKAEHPYYVEELGIYLYTAEELSYFIYHNLVLIGEDFLDERLFRFINQELGMPELETKLRKWSKQATLAELLLVILQDIHYYNSGELSLFKNELARVSKAGELELLKEKADYLESLHHYYTAIRLYDRILSGKSEELINQHFLGTVWFNKGSALAGIFSFDQAVGCYEKAYEFLHKEEILKKIYQIHLLDELSHFPEELFQEISPELLNRWREDFQKTRMAAMEEGKAREAAELKEKDHIRRAAGYLQLVHSWKKEYQRSQG